MTNPSHIIMGVIEVAYSSEYFSLAENNWDISILSNEMTLVRLYNSTHELCFVTRLEEKKLSYFLHFGTYQNTTNKIIHAIEFSKKMSPSFLTGKNQDEIFEIICQAFAERIYHVLTDKN